MRACPEGAKRFPAARDVDNTAEVFDGARVAISYASLPIKSRSVYFLDPFGAGCRIFSRRFFSHLRRHSFNIDEGSATAGSRATTWLCMES